MSSCHEDHAQGKELSSSSLFLSTRSQKHFLIRSSFLLYKTAKSLVTMNINICNVSQCSPSSCPINFED